MKHEINFHKWCIVQWTADGADGESSIIPFLIRGHSTSPSTPFQLEKSTTTHDVEVSIYEIIMSSKYWIEFRSPKNFKPFFSLNRCRLHKNLLGQLFINLSVNCWWKLCRKSTKLQKSFRFFPPTAAHSCRLASQGAETFYLCSKECRGGRRRVRSSFYFCVLFSNESFPLTNLIKYS